MEVWVVKSHINRAIHIKTSLTVCRNIYLYLFFKQDFQFTAYELMSLVLDSWSTINTSKYYTTLGIFYKELVFRTEPRVP